MLPGGSHARLRAMAAEIRAGKPPTDGTVAGLIQQHGALAVAALLEAVASERERAEQVADRRIELVWSGPEVDGAATRDTAVVLRELFGTATRSVVVAGFAVYDGESVFEALWERWEAVPDLSIELYLNVGRGEGETDPADVLVSRFRHRFHQKDWPWPRKPAVYYDPRALAPGYGPRAVLHAKCVVVDDEKAFVTSANLTEAAQLRNIEAGVLLHDLPLAARLASQFRALRDHGQLRAL